MIRKVTENFYNYDCALPHVPGFVDDSWRNDRCPKLCLDIGNYTVILWCDFHDPELRELQEEGKQYTAEFRYNDEPIRPEEDMEVVPVDFAHYALEILYTHWLELHKLPSMSADELLMTDKLDLKQRVWLIEFYQLWGAAC